jgi:iron complex transport system permease protein
LKALDIIALTLALLVLSIISLFIGPMPIRNIFDMSYQEHIVMFAARVPRLITIIVSGMGMSICGLIMQSLTRNRFVSPTTAGTMDGARLGVLVSMLVMGSANLFWRTFFAFAFTLLTTLVFIKMLERIKYKNVIFVPLVGIMYGNILASITMFFAYRHDLVQNVSTWLIGDFSGVLRGRFEMIYISIPLVILTYIYANKFVIAGMGEDFAKNLGLNYRLTMNIGLCIVSIIASIVLLTVGIIPFLGLIIPNLVSIFWGDNLRKTLPYAAAGGAIFLLVCDIIGRLIIHPFEVPINLTVGIIGGAIFLWLLLRKKTHG